MKIFKSSVQNKGAQVDLLEAKKSWILYILLGALFWLIGLVLWWQQQIDENVLLYFDATRVANTSLITLSQ